MRCGYWDVLVLNLLTLSLASCIFRPRMLGLRIFEELNPMRSAGIELYYYSIVLDQLCLSV